MKAVARRSLLLFHGCRSGRTSDSAPPDAWTSSAARVLGVCGSGRLLAHGTAAVVVSSLHGIDVDSDRFALVAAELLAAVFPPAQRLRTRFVPDVTWRVHRAADLAARDPPFRWALRLPRQAPTVVARPGGGRGREGRDRP